MTGLFNIHTVFGSLSPKQSEQEERAVCILPVEPVSSSEPEVSGCLFLPHPQMVVSDPCQVSSVERWCELLLTIIPQYS